MTVEEEDPVGAVYTAIDCHVIGGCMVFYGFFLG